VLIFVKESQSLGRCKQRQKFVGLDLLGGAMQFGGRCRPIQAR